MADPMRLHPAAQIVAGMRPTAPAPAASPDTFTPLGVAATRVIQDSIEAALDGLVAEINEAAAEARAHDSSTEALARKTDALRRAGETKPHAAE